MAILMWLQALLLALKKTNTGSAFVAPVHN
jgi:hypothetical protein